MTNEENDELLKLCAEFGSASDCERFDYFESEEWRDLSALLESEEWRDLSALLESEEWRDLSALLERAKEFEKDLPAFDVPDGFLLGETSFSESEDAR